MRKLIRRRSGVIADQIEQEGQIEHQQHVETYPPDPHHTDDAPGVLPHFFIFLDARAARLQRRLQLHVLVVQDQAVFSNLPHIRL